MKTVAELADELILSVERHGKNAQYIIESALKEMLSEQRLACAQAVSDCELIEETPTRIRKHEAMGACIGADII